MKRHILCLGDSNTHGYCADPADCADHDLQRFNEAERWPCLLQQRLGDEVLVIEEGLSGRTTVFDDPVREGMNALHYLVPCLNSHEPVALLIIMLGTNDTKEYFGRSAAEIDGGLRQLVAKAMETDCWDGERPNILVVAPPVMDPRTETSVVSGEMGRGCAAKSAQLAGLYEITARQLGVHFLNADGCEFNQVDYMHLTRRGHRQLADRLEQAVRTLL